MPGQLTDFIASISALGVAKTSHFTFNSGKVFQAGGQYSGVEQLLSARCESTELPGRQLVSNDSRIYGPTYKTPYQSVYQELTLTFVETQNFAIRGFFDAWMDQIFNSYTNLLQYPNAYRVDSSLTQYDTFITGAVDKGKPPVPPAPTSSLREIAEWTLYNTFPTAVNQMPVSWSEDGLHRTTVTLAFEYYQLSTGYQPIPNGISPGILKTPSVDVPPKGSADGIFSSLKSKFT